MCFEATGQTENNQVAFVFKQLLLCGDINCDAIVIDCPICEEQVNFFCNVNVALLNKHAFGVHSKMWMVPWALQTICNTYGLETHGFHPSAYEEPLYKAPLYKAPRW